MTKSVSKLFQYLIPNDSEPQIVKAVQIYEFICFRDSPDTSNLDKINLSEIMNVLLTD